MGTQEKVPVTLHPGRTKDDVLLVPTVLLTDYQRHLGPEGVLVWLHLKWHLLRHGEGEEVTWEELRQATGLSVAQWEGALKALQETGLVEIQREGFTVPQVIVHDPSSKEERSPEMTGLEEVAAASLPEEEERNEGPVDLEEVFQAYHDHIGLMSPVHFEKLRSWVEDRGLSPGLVMAAIRETARTATFRRMSYVEGILRNWYNDGLRTEEDLARFRAEQERQRQNQPRSTGRPAARGAESEMVNGGAYQRVSPEVIRRWKELYPDEYPD